MCAVYAEQFRVQDYRQDYGKSDGAGICPKSRVTNRRTREPQSRATRSLDVIGGSCEAEQWIHGFHDGPSITMARESKIRQSTDMGQRWTKTGYRRWPWSFQQNCTQWLFFRDIFRRASTPTRIPCRPCWQQLSWPFDRQLPPELYTWHCYECSRDGDRPGRLHVRRFGRA